MNSKTMGWGAIILGIVIAGAQFMGYTGGLNPWIAYVVAAVIAIWGIMSLK